MLKPVVVWKKAEQVFGGVEQAFLWFHEQNKFLLNSTPDSLMITEFGRKSVFELLCQIELENQE